MFDKFHFLLNGTDYTKTFTFFMCNIFLSSEGAPVIFSLPHFLYGDETIQNRVDGMHPNQEEHQSVIDIEPVTSVNLSHKCIHTYIFMYVCISEIVALFLCRWEIRLVSVG